MNYELLNYLIILVFIGSRKKATSTPFVRLLSTFRDDFLRAGNGETLEERQLRKMVILSSGFIPKMGIEHE